MNRITICKRIEWDAAHRVLRHESKCATLHGHRYAAEIACSADALDDLGRVIDFGVIKEVVGKWIDDNWDHNTLLNRDDLELIGICMRDAELRGRKEPYVFDGEPTAEHIADRLYSVANALLAPYSVRVTMVRIHETPS